VQIKALAAAENSGKNFVWLGSGENKNDVRRRFFQRLEQRIEGLLSEHVDFVDDVDLVFATNRSEPDIFPEFSNLIDAVVAGAINFQNVQTDSLRDFPTGITYTAWCDSGPVNAVQRFSEDTGSRGFAGSPWTNEQIGVSKSLLHDSVLERAHDVVLTEDFIEYLGTIFPRKNLVAHRPKLRCHWLKQKRAFGCSSILPYAKICLDASQVGLAADIYSGDFLLGRSHRAWPGQFHRWVPNRTRKFSIDLPAGDAISEKVR
jgi:hypothetical protein